MPGPLELENFGKPTPSQRRRARDQAQNNEEQLLHAFDKGYRAGWDDAVAAKAEEQANIADDLANSLRDLSFTFHEARTHMLSQLEPVLRDMGAKVLPQIAEQTLGQMLAETILRLSNKTVDAPVEIVVHPANRHAVDAVLPQLDSMPLRTREEPSLSEGQALIRFGTHEKSVDIASALGEIEGAINAFFHHEPEERKHA